MVVPETSATLGYPEESRVPINGNHLTITKYSSSSDGNYQSIVVVLQKLVTTIVESRPAEDS